MLFTLQLSPHPETKAEMGRWDSRHRDYGPPGPFNRTQDPLVKQASWSLSAKVKNPISQGEAWSSSGISDRPENWELEERKEGIPSGHWVWSNPAEHVRAHMHTHVPVYTHTRVYACVYMRARIRSGNETGCTE